MSEHQPGPLVYLVPVPLVEGGLATLSPQVTDAVKNCQVFFVENERSTRRFLKSIWREMVIDDYKWVAIHKVEQSVQQSFSDCLKKGSNIAILSEAGCPGIADPGQMLIALAHKQGARVIPLVGPSSVLLALMASGLNGQQFRFVGYLPIDSAERVKALKQLELESAKRNETQIFIETPYRNNQLMESMLKHLQPSTKLCVASDLTSATESIKTAELGEWKKNIPDLHKKPTIFCVLSLKN